MTLANYTRLLSDVQFGHALWNTVVFTLVSVVFHLLLGLDPTPLGTAPFALATDGPVETTAAALGLHAHPAARVYALPCIAGHVGADAAGIVLAERPDLGEEVTLLVDVGVLGPPRIEPDVSREAARRCWPPAANCRRPWAKKASSARW